MIRRIDITGKKFNMLTVVKYSHTKNNKAHWHLKCDCGNDKILDSGALKMQQSCG
ncbi:unnamed protein product, partial [marine sediment metagenome]